MSKQRKKLVGIGILAVLLVASLIIGLSLAFLQFQTNTKANNFTFSDGTPPPPEFSASLIEPAFDPDAALNLAAGATVPKDPQIINDSKLNYDQWVAIKVSFVYSDGPDKGKLLSAEDQIAVDTVVSINYDDTKWVASATNPGEYYYSELLLKGETTLPLFTEVEILSAAEQADLDAIMEFGGFTIFVEGYAAESIVADTPAAYLAWAPTGVVFGNTPGALPDGTNPTVPTPLTVDASGNVTLPAGFELKELPFALPDGWVLQDALDKLNIAIAASTDASGVLNLDDLYDAIEDDLSAESQLLAQQAIADVIAGTIVFLSDGTIVV